MKKAIRYLFLFLTISAYTQKPVIQMGIHIPPDEAKKRRNVNSYLMAGNENELLVADHTKGGGIVVTSYNSATLKKTGIFKLDYPEIDNKDADWVNRLFHKDKITTVYGYYDRQTDENRIYGKITDRANKSIKRETLLMTSSAKKRKNIGQLVTKYSKDKSKLLVFREPAGKKYENEKMEMVLYDNDLNKIFEKELSFPYKNRAISVQEIAVTNDGHISVLAFWEPTRDEIQDNPALKDQLTFKIFGVNEESEELDEIEVREPNYILKTCEAFINDDSASTILLTGLYKDMRSDSKRLSTGGINGVYYFRLNTNNWVIELMKFNSFDEKTMTNLFLGNYSSKRAQKKAKKLAEKGYGFYNLKVKQIYFDNEGHIEIIGQVEYVVTRCTTDPRTHMQSCIHYYYNAQILELKLNADGELAESTVIPKEQMMVNTDIYNGHISLKNDNMTYYLYNDDDRNYNAKKVARRKNNNFYYDFTASKKSRLCYVTVGQDGKFTKYPMTDSWKTNILIFPNETVRLSTDTVITWGRLRKSRELVLIKLSVKDGKSKG